MTQNVQEFNPKWNNWLSSSNLLTFTTYFGRFGRNGTKSITIFKLAILIYIEKLNVRLLVKLWKTNYKP